MRQMRQVFCEQVQKAGQELLWQLVEGVEHYNLSFGLGRYTIQWLFEESSEGAFQIILRSSLIEVEVRRRINIETIEVLLQHGTYFL